MAVDEYAKPLRLIGRRWRAERQTAKVLPRHARGLVVAPCSTNSASARPIPDPSCVRPCVTTRWKRSAAWQLLLRNATLSTTSSTARSPVRFNRTVTLQQSELERVRRRFSDLSHLRSTYTASKLAAVIGDMEPAFPAPTKCSRSHASARGRSPRAATASLRAKSEIDELVQLRIRSTSWYRAPAGMTSVIASSAGEHECQRCAGLADVRKVRSWPVRLNRTSARGLLGLPRR